MCSVFMDIQWAGITGDAVWPEVCDLKVMSSIPETKVLALCSSSDLTGDNINKALNPSLLQWSYSVSNRPDCGCAGQLPGVNVWRRQFRLKTALKQLKGLRWWVCFASGILEIWNAAQIIWTLIRQNTAQQFLWYSEAWFTTLQSYHDSYLLTRWSWGKQLKYGVCVCMGVLLHVFDWSPRCFAGWCCIAKFDPGSTFFLPQHLCIGIPAVSPDWPVCFHAGLLLVWVRPNCVSVEQSVPERQIYLVK